MNMARAPVSGTYTSVHRSDDDLAAQVRNARHVVEQDKRIVHQVKHTRRANSSDSSSSNNSGKRRGFDHLSTIQSQHHHVDIDSQEGKYTQSEYVRHMPNSTVRTISGHHDRPAVVKRVVISPGGTRREIDGHSGAVDRFGDAYR